MEPANPSSLAALESAIAPTSRRLAVFNGAVAGLALLIVFVLAILVALIILAGGGGAGWGGISVAIAAGRLIADFVFSLLTIGPLSVWLIIVSRWLWHGDVRGRQHLLWITWFVIGTVLAFGAFAWFIAREPGMYVFGILPALFASLNLVGLQPSRRSLVVSGVLIGTIFLSYGVSVSQRFAFANSGRIHCGIENGVTLLTATGYVVCIGEETSPATRENVLMAWKFDTGERSIRTSFPKFTRYDLGQSGNLLAAVVESTAGSGHFSDLLLCELPTGEQRARVPKVVKSGDCLALALSPAGDFAAVAWGWGTIDIYALPSGQLLRSLPAQSSSQREVRLLAFDPQGEYLAVATPSAIANWSIARADERSRWEIAISETGSMYVAPQGPQLIVCTNSELLTVDGATGEARNRSPHSHGDLFSICARGFSSDGRHFCIIQSDGLVRLWETSSGNSRSFSIGGQVGHSSAAINLDSMKMVVGPSTPGYVWLARWDVASAEELSSYAR